MSNFVAQKTLMIPKSHYLEKDETSDSVRLCDTVSRYQVLTKVCLMDS